MTLPWCYRGIDALKTGIIIQARMGSTRLPNKVMLLLAGKPVLWHVIERCQKARVGVVVIATSTNPENKIITDFCQTYNYPYFIGDEDNVLSRYYKTARKFKLDIIIRVTSDCPLIDPYLIDLCLNQFTKLRADFCYTSLHKRLLPLGLDFDIFTFSALKTAYAHATTKRQLEGVDPYFTDHDFIKDKENFTLCALTPPPSYYAPHLRLNLDEKADYQLLKKVFALLYRADAGINVASVIEYLNHHSKLAGLNAHVSQKS